MKVTMMVVAGVLAMGVAQVQAEDGRVSQSTLSAIGLGGMQAVSDADGMQVRGMSWKRSSGFISGRSLVVGQIIDPKTNSFVFASDTNGYFSTSKDGKTARTSGVIGELEIEFGSYSGSYKAFEGEFFGAAGRNVGFLVD